VAEAPQISLLSFPRVVTEAKYFLGDFSPLPGRGIETCERLPLDDKIEFKMDHLSSGQHLRTSRNMDAFELALKNLRETYAKIKEGNWNGGGGRRADFGLTSSLSSPPYVDLHHELAEERRRGDELAGAVERCFPPWKRFLHLCTWASLHRQAGGGEARACREVRPTAENFGGV
jgi:hypothetical protein